MQSLKVKQNATPPSPRAPALQVPTTGACASCGFLPAKCAAVAAWWSGHGRHGWLCGSGVAAAAAGGCMRRDGSMPCTTAGSVGGAAAAVIATAARSCAAERQRAPGVPSVAAVASAAAAAACRLCCCSLRVSQLHTEPGVAGQLRPPEGNIAAKDMWL